MLAACGIGASRMHLTVESTDASCTGQVWRTSSRIECVHGER